VKNIIVAGGVPQFFPNLPTRLLNDNIRLDGEHFLKLNTDKIREADDRLRALSSDKGVEFISILDELCDGDECKLESPHRVVLVKC